MCWSKSATHNGVAMADMLATNRTSAMKRSAGWRCAQVEGRTEAKTMAGTRMGWMRYRTRVAVVERTAAAPATRDWQDASVSALRTTAPVTASCTWTPSVSSWLRMRPICRGLPAAALKNGTSKDRARAYRVRVAEVANKADISHVRSEYATPPAAATEPTKDSARRAFDTSVLWFAFARNWAALNALFTTCRHTINVNVNFYASPRAPTPTLSLPIPATARSTIRP